MTKLTYKCSKCSWEKSIPVEWGDLRPKYCGNKACLTSFMKEPEALLVLVPKKIVPEQEKAFKYKNKIKKEDQNG